MNVPFRYKDNTRWATEVEKQAGYKELKMVYQKNKKPDGTINIGYEAYRNSTSLLLSQDLVNSIARKKIDQFEKELLVIFPDFKCYPSPARQAIMDMMYNIGANRFNDKKWGDLFKAIRVCDWEAAAAESHRKEPSDIRNNVICDLFLKSIVIEKETLR